MNAPSADSISALRAAGLSMEAIGQAVGRNRSLIRQIGLGVKPGENLRVSLEALRRQVEGAPDTRAAARAATVPPAARRTTRAGGAARVRRPVTVSGGSWSTSTLKRQGASHGAGGLVGPLERASRQGRSVAVTVAFTPAVTVLRDYGKRGRSGAGGVVDMKLGDAGAILADLQANGGTFSDYVLQAAAEEGLISHHDAGRGDALDSVELRSF